MKESKRGRGGLRKGAGRKPKVAKTDWNAVGQAYFSGREHPHEVCVRFGVTFGDLLAYAAARGWVWPAPDGHPDDMGELGSALAVAMFGVAGGVRQRARSFVAAMAKLNAHVPDIAAALHVSESDLRAEFPKELAGARG
jgi:hypothetical protein